MGKSLYIAEKPSVAMEFAKALKENMARHDGYQESENVIVTWCVGHLITMSYPEVYDEKYKRWSLSTLPFLPKEFLYEVIPSVKKQFETIKELCLRKPRIAAICGNEIAALRFFGILYISNNAIDGNFCRSVSRHMERN